MSWIVPGPVAPISPGKKRSGFHVGPDAPSLIGNEGSSERIDDPLLQWRERLRPHFEAIRAVRFAYRGE
jgi:hypothetical protein